MEFWPEALKDLSINLIASLIAFLLGVGWAKRQWKKDQEHLAKNLRIQLVKAFKSAVSGLDQGLGFLKSNPPTIPNYRIDTATISHILLNGRDLTSEDLFTHLNWQRYQLDHINTKLDYLHMYLSASGDGLSTAVLEGFGSLVVHMETTKKEISSLLPALEKKLDARNYRLWRISIFVT